MTAGRDFPEGLYNVKSEPDWNDLMMTLPDSFLSEFAADEEHRVEVISFAPKELELSYENVPIPKGTEIQTQAMNVIVIMDESFSDLRVINDQLVSGSYMPFIDSLESNTVKGHLYVPVFGNGTCDTEFEALTGVSTSYTGAYPYVIQDMENVDSLTSELKKKGYKTLAFHPYLKENWNRFNVYSALEFDEFLDGLFPKS